MYLSFFFHFLWLLFNHRNLIALPFTLQMHIILFSCKVWDHEYGVLTTEDAASELKLGIFKLHQQSNNIRQNSNWGNADYLYTIY